MKLKVTPIKFSVHHESECPLFGDSVTHCEFVDEGAGPFITIKTFDQGSDEINKVRIDIDHLNLIYETVKNLKRNFK